jgi:hypothetical protein
MADRFLIADGPNRQAALASIAGFCEREGFAVPDLEESPISGGIKLVGKSPDGREFAIGYEHDYGYSLWTAND